MENKFCWACQESVCCLVRDGPISMHLTKMKTKLRRIKCATSSTALSPSSASAPAQLAWPQSKKYMQNARKVFLIRCIPRPASHIPARENHLDQLPDRLSVRLRVHSLGENASLARRQIRHKIYEKLSRSAAPGRGGGLCWVACDDVDAAF